MYVRACVYVCMYVCVCVCYCVVHVYIFLFRKISGYYSHKVTMEKKQEGSFLGPWPQESTFIKRLSIVSCGPMYGLQMSKGSGHMKVVLKFSTTYLAAK